MPEKLYDIKTDYLDERECRVVFKEYAERRRPCIRIESKFGEPLMTATINLVQERCDYGCTFIKDYSENKGILAELVRHGIVEHTGKVVTCGREAADEVRILNFREQNT